MIVKIKRFLKGMSPDQEPILDTKLAIVSLLCEVCMADQQHDPSEHKAVLHLLEKVLNVDEQQAEQLLQQGMKEIQESNSVFDFTSQLSGLDHQSRYNLIRAMWQVAYADKHIDPLEEALIRKVASLIYINHSDFIRAKHDVMPS